MEVRADLYLFFRLADGSFVISRKPGDTLWMKKQTISGKSATDPEKLNLMTSCSSVCIMFRWAAGSHS
jgi:hypothetical protein